MKRMDKIVEMKAKKLGLSVEECREKIDEQIWIKLYMERKVIDPASHLHQDIRQFLSESLFFLVVALIAVEVKEIYIVLVAILFFGSRFLIYIHDKRLFKKYKEEVVEEL